MMLKFMDQLRILHVCLTYDVSTDMFPRAFKINISSLRKLYNKREDKYCLLPCTRIYTFITPIAPWLLSRAFPCSLLATPVPRFLLGWHRFLVLVFWFFGFFWASLPVIPLSQPKQELASMHAHQRAERNQNCPSWSNDWPCLLIHLRDRHWALTLQWPCFLGPCLCQADSLVGRKPGGSQQFLDILLCCHLCCVWKVILGSQKPWVGDGILYLENVSLWRHVSSKTLCPNNQISWAHIGPRAAWNEESELHHGGGVKRDTSQGLWDWSGQGP